MTNEVIHFHKMQGAGNDFVIIDNRVYGFRLKKLIELTPTLCNRKYGIGADGLIALTQPDIDGTDYTMIYRNADGSDAGMCGNGARCLALYAYRSGLGKHQKFNVHEHVYRAEIFSEEEVEISFPVSTSIESITLDGQKVYQVHPGTEHIVLEKSEQELGNESELRKTGRELRRHSRFQPVGTNVNFICGKEPNRLNIQTYERGVEDLTLACGTGAVASALAWHHIQGKQEQKERYTVNVPGGRLEVAFQYDASAQTYSDLKLKGPAHFVFEGTYNL